MTIKELFTHLATGSVKVKSNKPVKDATSDIGIIDNIQFYGAGSVSVCVQFPGTKWTANFFSEKGMRKNIYLLSELSAVEPEEVGYKTEVTDFVVEVGEGVDLTKEREPKDVLPFSLDFPPEVTHVFNGVPRETDASVANAPSVEFLGSDSLEASKRNVDKFNKATFASDNTPSKGDF